MTEPRWPAGARARLVCDDWSLIGQEVEVIEPEPVRGSTQCLVRLADGQLATVAWHEMVAG